MLFYHVQHCDLHDMDWCKAELATSASGTKLTVKKMRLRMLHANPFGSSRKERAADE